MATNRTENKYNIRNFYNTIAQQTPLLQEYQFLVTIINGGSWPGDPLSFDAGDLVDFKKLQLFCQSARIPQKTINVSPVNFFGKNFQIPTTEAPQHEWQTKIILTNDMSSYTQLRSLMLAFSSPERNMGGVRTIPNIDILVDILNQFSEVDDTQPRIVLKGCYPKTMDTINLAYQDNANVMTPNCTFVYQYSYFARPGVDHNDFDTLNRNAAVQR